MAKSISVNKLHNELRQIKRSMVTKNEMNAYIETIGVLMNESTMKQLDQSDKDIKHGRIKLIKSVNEI